MVCCAAQQPAPASASRLLLRHDVLCNRKNCSVEYYVLRLCKSTADVVGGGSTLPQLQRAVALRPHVVHCLLGTGHSLRWVGCDVRAWQLCAWQQSVHASAFYRCGGMLDMAARWLQWQAQTP